MRLKKVIFIFVSLFIFLENNTFASELLFCQPEKDKPYVAVFSLPTSSGETLQAKLFTGWAPPYKLDAPVKCFDQNNAKKDTTVVATCGVQYGPDGGQSLYLHKSTKPGSPYYLVLTAEGPTGSGSSQTMPCN